jgi:hypothetical protein
MRKIKYCLSVIILLFLCFVPKANAMTAISDTISTSRPSTSTNLNAAITSGSTIVNVVNNASAVFLSSDSAKLRQSAGTGLSIVTVASASAATLWGTRAVYLTGTAGGGYGIGDLFMVPITAMHKVQFTTAEAIPANGKVTITFPGSADSSASPSATTFAFNGITDSTYIKVNGITCDGSWTVSSPSITCITTAGVSPGTVVTFLIGCSANSGASCTTQVPRLINPTKSNTTEGSADTWKVNVQTKTSADVVVDEATVKVGTIESVTVRATVDPTLTFTITGIANATAINTGNATGCTNAETTNTGIASTATVVDLGILGNTPTGIDTKVSNIAAQLITISTNAPNGYALTATSSGQLISHASGYSINSNTTPASFPNGNPWFGIHPCGLDVAAATWVEGGASQSCNSYIIASAGTECYYGWPTSTTAVTLASDATGPIGSSILAGNGLTSVEYAAGVNVTVPAGLYTSTVTYVATPTF